jgi:enterochelin esterase-like enzyme
VRRLIAFAILGNLVASATLTSATAQEPGRAFPPPVVSPEVAADKKATFRIHAPKAESVKLSGSDIPGLGRGTAMTKSDAGVWEATVGPLAPGAYRYSFDVDGLTVVDPRNPSTSESNSNTWSLVYVPGADLQDLKDVPHGAVAQVNYHSSTLKRPRRMHVYTPPGYENGEGRFPVFYLLHGAFDCDASWSTVGRAGLILDNLIAAGKAKPMIVVMPAGHTGPFRFGPPGENSFERQMEEFAADFVKDVKPCVESKYRVRGERSQRAIAGLSMGGAQTLNIAFANLNEYGYVGVFSSGIFGIVGGPNGTPPPSTQWEDKNKSILDDADLKSGLKLLWIACGKEDFLVQTSKATEAMLKNHHFDVVSRETDGGHTWSNWRDYLIDFAPQLFSDK